jgi:trigger factor
MQVTETLSDGLRRGFTVILPAAELDTRRTERLTTLGKTLRLPGFRPGKVPLPIVRQRYGTAVSAEILDESVSEATQKVLSERGLRPARQPKVDLVTENPSAFRSDLEFKVEMEVMPEIALPDFSAISLTRVKAEVTPELVDQTMQRIARNSRTLEPIPAEELLARPEGDGAMTGDVLMIDFLGKIDDVAFEGGAGTDIPVDIGGDGFIPGFAEQLVGARPGEIRVIEVTFPADYGNAEVAGKPATFEITVKQLNRQIVPALDDELAKKLGAESLTGIREVVTSRQQQEYDQMTRVRLKKDLLDALTVTASFMVPPSMVEDEFKQIWSQLEQARKAGTEDAEDKGKDDETLTAEYRPIAERRVRLGLLLAEIARSNSITVTDQELNRAVYARAMQYPGQEAQMLELYQKYPQFSNSVRGPLMEDKVVDFVLELANVTDRVVAPEELAKELDTPPDTVAA